MLDDNATIFDWRAHLQVHPAADIFPLLPEAELKELAADIEAHGLRAPPVAWSPVGHEHVPVLLDGRNRLDALALLGLLYDPGDHHVSMRTWTGAKWAKLSGARIEFQHLTGGDPQEIALSLNLHRRHLTSEQKRELIAKLLKVQPEKSDRIIAGAVKVDHKTVASVRAESEARGEIPHVEKRADTKGRAQPAKKMRKAPEPGSEEYERDKAECIALYQKAEAADSGGADAAPGRPRVEPEIIPPDKYGDCPHCHGTGKVQVTDLVATIRTAKLRREERANAVRQRRMGR